MITETAPCLIIVLCVLAGLLVGYILTARRLGQTYERFAK